MFSTKATTLLLFAIIGVSWLHYASVRAAPVLDDLDSALLNASRRFDNFSEHFDSWFGLNDSEGPRKGPINYWGSRTYQRNIVYGADGGKDSVYGSLDVQTGNSYSGDPDATNVYGPILVQENITYRGKNENAQYGASVLRANNSFDHNLGKNDIYNPIVIQSNNTYHNNVKNDSVLGANALALAPSTLSFCQVIIMILRLNIITI